MLWMGGEPMLRWKTVAKGVGLFRKNVITTNGTLALRPFPANVQYVVSLDGPEEINDQYRGKGIFQKVMARIAALPEDFPNTVQVQCVVHKGNEEHLSRFVAGLRKTKVDGVTFTFLSPSLHDHSASVWKDLGEREKAIDIVLSLKSEYPGFVWNSVRAMELMRSTTAKLVTDNCPLLKNVMPLFIEKDHFVTPFCCMGDVADCDRCGQWGVFAQAAKMLGPWDALLPPSKPYEEFSLL
jgi:MoaA/NifB/PqqE/SkfB family radical SAM enzyme